MKYKVVPWLMKNSIITDGILVPLIEIQPGEPYLVRSTIKYFLKCPGKIFSMDEGMRIISLDNLPFRYFSFNGNHRLFSLWKKGVTEILLTPETDPVCLAFPPDNEEKGWVADSVMDVFRLGIKKWPDLENRLVTKKEFERILMSM
jgi:hypothetical protein